MYKRLAVLAAGAVFSVLALGTGSASAAGPTPQDNLNCSTTGARGAAAVWPWYAGETSVSLDLSVNDTLADGHHVQVRVLAKSPGDTVIYYGWHQWTAGNGTSGLFPGLTAINSTGIYDIGIEVGRFEGSTMLNHCVDWVRSDVI